MIPLVVIDAWISLPILLRWIVVAALGLAGGALANYLIYSWSYFPRPISPFAPTPAGVAPRNWRDRLPLIGWLRLRREHPLHGPGFWIRPLLLEIALAAGLVALYWFETQVGGLLEAPLRVPLVIDAVEPWMTRIFFGHALLVILMTAATFIDFDEQTIPDIITIPGTLLALLSGAISAMGFMPTSELIPVTYNLPWVPPDAKWFTSTGLVTGLAIWSGWCFALADRRVITRRGLFKAVEYFFAGLVRFPSWKLLLAMWAAGLVGISVVHSIGGQHWFGLWTALVGLAVGGGIVWSVRLVASWAMGMEAMGFGDVTLMAMIGAWIGWQASVAAFFLSPLAAIAIVLVQYIITREPRVPFGPYLCAGTMITILFWSVIYPDFLSQYLLLGQFLLWLLIGMLLLMGVFLRIWRSIKQALFY